MAIQLPVGITVTGKDSIDTRILLTKEEMLAVKKARMPEKYFCICKDDGKLYLYDENNELNPDTGKYRLLESGEQRNAYESISKIKDYLYEVVYCGLDYDYANEWFKYSNDTTKPGACSSFRNGDWYGRNFDWFYNNQANFIIKTPRIGGKFASIGVGGNVAELTNEVVASGAYNENYKIVPFKLLDGINEYGVFANTNVVPNQYGETTGTTPLQEQKLELCNLALPRFILDNFKTAKEAVEYIRDHVSVYGYAPLYSFYKEDIHVMVGDKDETYIIEFVENEVKIELCDRPIMTNFFRFGVEFNEDGSVYTPEMFWADGGKNPIEVNKVTSHGNGLERHNVINESLDLVASKEDARNLLTNIFYTNAYKDNVPAIWYSELAGETDTVDITLDSPESTFKSAFEIMKDMFARRSRETGDTWQTVHSCVYDLVNKKFYLVAQEDGEEIEVTFDYYTAHQVDELLKDVEISSDKLALKLPDALNKAMQGEGAQEIADALFNSEHFNVGIDNKIDLALELIQAIGPNE